jgi:hypothetical protein
LHLKLIAQSHELIKLLTAIIKTTKTKK